MLRFRPQAAVTRALETAVLVLAMATTAVRLVGAQGAVSVEPVAVLPVVSTTALPTEARLATDRIRIELLNTGKFSIIPPRQIDEALKKAGVQDRSCAEPECARTLGKSLSVRRVVFGTLALQDANHWVMTGSLIDVDTGAIMRVSSVRSEGGSLSFINDAVAVVAARIAEIPPPADLLLSGKVVEQVPAAPAPSRSVPAPVAAASRAEPPPPIYGCGPGGMLFKDSKNNYARFWAFITNYTFWYLWTSSSTSGTSNCTSDHILKNEYEQQIFIAANLDALQEDMARGQGAHVHALATLMGCPSTLQARFVDLSKSRYRDAIGPVDADWAAVWMDLRTEARRDPDLAASCTRLS